MNSRIRKLRRELDLTQDRFGARIGVKGNTVAQWELGRNEPSDSAIVFICREFGVCEEWLRSGTGEMFVPDASDELEALVKRYDLSHADQVLIEKYVNLKASSRETIINFVTDVTAALGDVVDPNAKAFPNGNVGGNEKTGDPFPDIPKTPEELERRYPPVRPDTKKSS